MRLLPLCLLVCACSPQVQATDRLPSPLQVDLGLLEDAFTHQTRTFALENGTSSAWDVERIKPSCGCVQVRSVTKHVPAGGKLEIEFTYDPRGMRGGISQSLTAILAGSRAFRVAEIVGSVVPGPYAEPSSFAHPGLRAASTVVNVTTPGVDGFVEVAEMPADVEIRPRSRTLSGSLLVSSFEITALDSAVAGGPEACSFRIHYGGGRPEATLVLPVVRSTSQEIRLRQEIVVVARRGELDEEVLVPWTQVLAPRTLATLSLVVDPPGVWNAHGSTEGLWLVRQQPSFEDSVTCEISGLGATRSSLLILPYSPDQP